MARTHPHLNIVQPVIAVAALFAFHYFHMLTASKLHKSMLLVALGQRQGIDVFFQVPVQFYRFIESLGVPLDVFGLLAGALITLYFFRRRTTYLIFGIKLFLLIPAFMLYLGVPAKEFFLLSFMIISTRYWVRQKKLMATLIDLTYAIVFRIYFLPFVVGKYAFNAVPKYVLYIGVIFVPIFLCYVPPVSDLVGELMVRRDQAFLEYRGVIRSAFSNPLTLSQENGIFLNYAYAFIRLNFPILFYFGPRELFLQIYVILFFFIVLSSRECSPALKTATLIHVFILVTFEPDLGSYIRHLSSLFPWVFMLLEGQLRNQTVHKVDNKDKDAALDAS